MASDVSKTFFVLQQVVPTHRIHFLCGVIQPALFLCHILDIRSDERKEGES